MKSHPTAFSNIEAACPKLDDAQIRKRVDAETGRSLVMQYFFG
jgi:hypothetical protein